MTSRRLALPPWAFSGIFAGLVLLLIFAVSGRPDIGSLVVALQLAPFLVIVGLGQMLVITAGAGNIDISVAAIMTYGGYLSITVAEATGSWLVGLLAAAGMGILTAVLSVFAIFVVRVPPIVATLVSGLLVSSFTLSIANGFTGTADASLTAFTRLQVGGIPVFALVVAVFTAVVWAVLTFTVYGRQLLAVGQAPTAAGYAGIRTNAITASTYLISGALAGLAGGTLSAYLPPNPTMGESYLLDSIAIVVVGGTLIAGGRAVPVGVWGGAVFFILLDSLLNLVGWDKSGQSLLKGALLLAVLLLAGGGSKAHALTRRPARRPTSPDESVPVAEAAK